MTHRFLDHPVLLLVGLMSLGSPTAVTAADCNHNGVQDLNDIQRGVSTDCNDTQIPDECEGVPMGFVFADENHETSSPVEFLRTADLDSDGDLDVLVGIRDGVQVYLNDGAGDFDLAEELGNFGNIIDAAVDDLDEDGIPDLALATTEGVVVFLNSDNGSQSAPTTYPLALVAGGLTSGDLDGDGRPELIASGRQSNQLFVLSNHGEGEFSGTDEFPLQAALDVTPDVRTLLTADLDLDGDLDLAALSRETDQFMVILNQGNGSLGLAASYPARGLVVSSSDLLALDIDGDQFPELVARLSNGISVLPNRDNGDGTFGDARLDTGLGRSLQPGDFDADGDVDLVLASVAPSGVEVRFNDGLGNYRTRDLVDPGALSTLIKVGDLDGDRVLDIVSASNRSWRVIRGGEFAEERFRFTTRTIPLSSCQNTRACRPHSGNGGDLDGDGDLDVIGCNTHPGSFSIAINNNGTLVPQPGYTFGGFGALSGEHPQYVALGDVDGDLDLDAVTVDNLSHDLWVHFNRGDASFEPAVRTPVGTAPINVRLGDFDGDGDLDAASANQGANTVSVLYNNDAGVFETIGTRDYRVGSSPKAVALGDADGDGTLDIAAACLQDDALTLLFNQGDRSFGSRQDVPVAGRPNHVEFFDIDEDGDLDLLACVPILRMLSVLLNDGEGNFGNRRDFPTNRGSYSFVVVDYDRNGTFDIVTANEFPQSESTLSILTGRGDGTFDTPQLVLIPNGQVGLTGPRFVVAGDLEGDGVVELVSINREGQTFTVVRSIDVPVIDYLGSICTASDFYALAMRSSKRFSGVERFVKYIIPVRDDPLLLPTAFQNSKTYALHKNFLEQVFPDRFPALDSAEYYNLTGRRASRQYFVGSISRLLTPDGAVYGFSVFAEFSDSTERLSMEEIGTLRDRLAQDFQLEPFGYFPGTPSAEEVARSWLDPEFLIYYGADGSAITFEAYTRGVGYGRVRILDATEFQTANESGTLSFQDVLVLEEAPRDILGVVGGVVTAQRQGEFSHVAVRTARRGTPNCFSAKALERFARFEGTLVRLEVSEGGFAVEEASSQAAEAFWEAIRQELSVPPTVDESFTEFSSLEEIAAMESGGAQQIVPRFGGKASNLARLQTILTGPFAEYREKGFAIPAHFYLNFMRTNVLPSVISPGSMVSYEAYITELLDDGRFQSDSVFRFEALSRLRSHMQDNGQIDPGLLESAGQRIRDVLESPDTTRVRFRSSSNMEDAIEFNGAGLYDSTSGCRADDFDGDTFGPSRCDPTRNNERTVDRALKRVWSSLWNFGAFEERSFYRIDQSKAAMAVLVNRTFIDEAVNGVAFTGNPSNANDRRTIVTAQMGEQSVVSPDPGVRPEKSILTVRDGEVVDILRATRSTFVPRDTFVMSDDRLRELGRLLDHINKNLPVDPGEHDRDDVLLDIEFKIEANGDLAVKQVRPFLITGPALPNPTFELEIPSDGVACGQFRIGRRPQREYELKSQLFFSTTSLPLPTRDVVFTTELVEKIVVGQDGLVALPAGEGEMTVSKTVQGNGVIDYAFKFLQPFEIESSGTRIELEISGLRFQARDGDPVTTILALDDDALTHQILIEGEFQGEDAVGEFLSFSSCTQSSLPLSEFSLELEDGTLLEIDERFDSTRAREFDFSPASLTFAHVEMNGESRGISSYWNLVYAAEKHNEHPEYWIVLNPPMTAPDVTAPVHVIDVIPPDDLDLDVVPVANYLGANLEILATVGIPSHSQSETTERRFRRGDVDTNGNSNATDALVLLNYLFVEGPKPKCEKSADASDDGRIDLTDAILIVLHLFRGNELAHPTSSCARDATPDALSCDSFTPCGP